MRPTSFNDRLAVRMTHIIGTMPMFYSLITWYVLWIGINVALGSHAFDKPWSFSILLFLSNFLQLIWLPAISVGQNVLSRAGEAQAQRQYAMIQRIDQITQAMTDSMTAQRAMLTTLIDLADTSTALLKAVEAKTQEIDAEVDALTAKEGMPT